MAVLIGLYTLGMLAGMYRYGIECWLDSGEMFSVYTGTMATLSPIEVREHRRRAPPRLPAAGRRRDSDSVGAGTRGLRGRADRHRDIRRPVGQRLLDHP